MSARPSATPCVSMKPAARRKRRRERGQLKGKSRRIWKARSPSSPAAPPDRRGRGVRCAATACASPCWTWTARAARGRRRRPRPPRLAGRHHRRRAAGTVRGRGRQALRPAGLPGQPGRHLPGRRRGIGPRGPAARAGHQPGQRGRAPRASPGRRRRRHRQLHQHLGQGAQTGAGSIRCPRPRWCSSHATWRWTSPATASASIRCRQAGPGRA